MEWSRRRKENVLFSPLMLTGEDCGKNAPSALLPDVAQAAVLKCTPRVLTPGSLPSEAFLPQS